MIAAAISLISVEFYFLVIFYSFPGILITYFYYTYSITLLEDRIIYQNFWFQRKSIKWASIKAIKGTLQKSIVIQHDKGQIKIIDVFKDRRKILDHIIKHVDKTIVSKELMDEWSQFFTIFNEDFKKD